MATVTEMTGFFLAPMEIQHVQRSLAYQRPRIPDAMEGVHLQNQSSNEDKVASLSVGPSFAMCVVHGTRGDRSTMQKEVFRRRSEKPKLTAPEGLPRRSPTLVLTGPCAA